LEEIGPIEPEAALSGTGPRVAYVPGIEDTQPIPSFVVPESHPAEPEPDVVSAPETEPVMAAVEPETVVAFEPVTELEPVISVAEPEPVVAPEPVFAVAHEAEKVAEETITEPEAHASLTPVMEAAAAVAAGGAALAGAAHFFSVAEPAPVHEEAHAVEAFVPAIEEPVAEAPAEIAIEPVIPEAPFHEPMGDAALAEELAAALARTEAEAQATAAADAAIANTIEPVAVEAAESASPEHMIADAKLSEAVSRALEKLRPQLIAEIMKELFK